MNNNIAQEITMQSLFTGINHILKVEGPAQINHFTENEYGAFNKMNLVHAGFNSNRWVSQFDLEKHKLSLKDNARPVNITTLGKGETNGKKHKVLRTYKVYNEEQVNF
ncbi:MAG: hypothetical protein KDD46_08735 [Bdellovibrionales bacterium]|nr:hypothetical protein [Bdellovibrionales bacterium]